MSEEKEHWTDKAIDNILDAIDKIKFGRVIILTGDNGSGKSLIRKLIPRQLSDLNGGEDVKVATTSMDKRAGIDANIGGLSVFNRDCEWLATSNNSFSVLKGIVGNTKDRFVIIDEPEIGMSESLQMSVGRWLDDRLPEVIERNKCVMIITHSKRLVEQIRSDHDFINIQGLSEREWLDKEPEMINLEDWEKHNLEMYRALQKRLR